METHLPANLSNVDNYLYSVSAVSDSNVWAVGSEDDFNGFQPIAENWNGSSWSLTSFSQTYNSEFYGVAALDASHVWAVGYKGCSSAMGVFPYDTHPTDCAGLTLIELYNGSSWSVKISPNGNTSTDNALTGVCVTGTSNAWASGYYVDNSGNYKTYIVKWNGTAWNSVTTPNPGTNNILYSVACASSSDVWAVGDSDTKPLMIHTTDGGSTWTYYTSPNPSGSLQTYLEGVTCVASNDCWAVGEDLDSGTNRYKTLTLNWTTSWSIVSSPNGGSDDNGLSSVAAMDSSWIWAAGFFDKPPFKTLAERADGSSWGIDASPNQGTGANQLHGVAVVPGTSACAGGPSWAVGWYTNASTGYINTLAESYTITPQCSP